VGWLYSGVAGFLITAMAIVALRPVAVAIDLVDRPGGRKTHHGEVPVVGGVAMFIGVVVGLGLLPVHALSEGVVSAAFGILVLIGLLDDRFSLSPWLRLLVHIGVAVLLFKLAGCRIETLGNAFGLGDIRLSGAWPWALTALCVSAAVNAFNMLDGMDGLAGTTAGVSFAAMAYAAWHAGAVEVVGYCAVMMGVIGGFLVFNLPVNGRRRLRCFMGDAGSTLLGVAVAYAMVWLTQGINGSQTSMHPVTALWIGGLPLIELTWSFIRRVCRGRSPFAADAEHFHHLMLQAGFSVRGAFFLLLLLAVILSACGLLLERFGVSEYVSLVLLAAVGVFVVRSMYSVGWLLEFMPGQARRPADQG
jgi:UDP-GlcNAc:undecaprenyl-phosphate/decaprenyl-phosphate GlcNAc-1-phosphate transferase